MYIELDHNLVAGNVENINEKVVLGGRKEDEEREAARSEDWRTDEYLLNKYNISKQPVRDVLLKKESESPKVIRSDSLEQIAKVNMAKMAKINSQKQQSKRRTIGGIINSIRSFGRRKNVDLKETMPSGESLHQQFDFSQTKTHSETSREREDDGEKQVKKEEEEVVIGSDGEVFFDHDFGFFGAVLACYNNHWVLKTSPDDWWNVIVR